MVARGYPGRGSAEQARPPRRLPSATHRPETVGTSTGVSAQNKRGEWVTAIPLPLYLPFGLKRCDCKRRFWTERGYRAHYALVHILGQD